jgi:hypothetical protein
MNKRQQCITTIINMLTRLPKLVESSAKLNLTDVNNFAEDFYEQLLNLIYGYSLVNANEFDPNASAIDLRDSKNRLAVQVTSTRNIRKTKYTVEKFIEYERYKDFDRLVILNIVKKSKHNESYIGTDIFKLDTTKDIWDIDDLLRDIKFIRNIDQLVKIKNYLVGELQDQPETTLPNEVNTILSMIEMLSNQHHPDAGAGFLEDPDPDGKIRNRFSEHSEYLINRYYDLYIEYGKVVGAIHEESDIGAQELRRAGTYLKGYSDNFLTQCDGNPVEALDRIVAEFKLVLSGLGAMFDSGAAEFYVVDQLIKCNVFPNRKV